MAKRQTVEKALRELQHLARRRTTAPERRAMSVGVPMDLQRPGFVTLILDPDERVAFERAWALLDCDLRFEHLGADKASKALDRLVCLAYVERNVNHVPGFVDEHSRELMQRTCFFPVDHLSVEVEADLFSVRWLPTDAVSPPPRILWPAFDLGTRAIVGVRCVGTNHDQMANRARAIAERALRLLRAVLREDRCMSDRQLRFRLGPETWFDDDACAWSSQPEQASSLSLNAPMFDQAASHELATLPAAPTNDVERRVERALTWFEHSQLAVDPLHELLFLFFALEAILGDAQEGLKARDLAMRRAMLGLAVRGSFAHPARAYRFYDKVRSAAVHGEEPPEVSSDDLVRFASDIRFAIREFLRFACGQGFTRRAQVRRALDADPRRTEMEAALVAEDPKLWREGFRDQAG